MATRQVRLLVDRQALRPCLIRLIRQGGGRASRCPSMPHLIVRYTGPFSRARSLRHRSEKTA